MANERFEKNLGFLKSICKCKDDADFSTKLKVANLDEVKAMGDFLYNLMCKQLPVNEKEKAMLKANRIVLRHIINPNNSIKSKVRYMQKGWGLGSLFRSLGSQVQRIGRAQILRRVTSAPKVLQRAKF